MGSNKTQSTSAPVTAADRLKSYNAGMGAMNPNYASYEDPQTERLGAGDYENVRAGLEAPIARQQELALKHNDQNMSDRGIYTSLNAIRSNDNTRETYAPQFAATGAALANLKAQDIAASNANKLTVADKQYESKWRPEDYKAGIWNGTGGVVSSSTSGGWSI